MALTSSGSRSKQISFFLRQAIGDVQKKNPALSLRSIAKRLKISPSYFSKIVNGQRKIPPALLGKLGEVLGLDHLLLKNLQSLMIAQIEEETLKPETGMAVRDLKSDDNGGGGLRDYETLNSKEFWLIEKWYYPAVLNLTTTEGFKADPIWIGKRLGISSASAREGLGVLLMHGYFKKGEDGSLVRTSLKCRFPTSQSHDLVRSYHAAHLRKAEQLLDRPDAKQTFDQRLISGISFAGDSTRLATAKAMVHEALYKAAEYLADGNCDEVFHMGLQLFPVTRKIAED